MSATDPAYPMPPYALNLPPGSSKVHLPSLGLTKREVAAIAALQGLCSVPGALTARNIPEMPGLAIQLADALLAALAKEPTK